MKVQGGFLEGLGDLEGLGEGFWRVFGGFWGGWPGECLKGSGRVFRFFLVNQSLADLHYYKSRVMFKEWGLGGSGWVPD